MQQLLTINAMKSELILTKAFILVLLVSCNAADKDKAKAVDQDKFILTGRIENAGELESIRLLEGENGYPYYRIRK